MAGASVPIGAPAGLDRWLIRLADRYRAWRRYRRLAPVRENAYLVFFANLAEATRRANEPEYLVFDCPVYVVNDPDTPYKLTILLNDPYASADCIKQALVDYDTRQDNERAVAAQIAKELEQ